MRLLSNFCSGRHCLYRRALVEPTVLSPPKRAHWRLTGTGTSRNAGGSRQRARFNTGIRLRQTFLPFIKEALQSALRSKLHVEIKTSTAKPNELIEVVLVSCGEKPQFEEAKVLVGKTIEMTEENWEDLKGKAKMSSKNTEPIDLDDSIEELSSEDESEDVAKENKESPRTAVVCGSNETNGLCTVVLDISGGPASTSNTFPVSEFTKEKVNDSNLLSCTKRKSNNIIRDPSDNSSRNPTTTKEDVKVCGEDFIFLKSKSGKISQNDTVVLDDDTILISSDSESEEDILIDKVVQAMPDIPKKRGKKKKSKLSSVVKNPLHNSPPLISNGKKRKSKDSDSLSQRNSKILKSSDGSDASCSKGVVNSHNPKKDKGPKSGSSNSKRNIPTTTVKHNFANNVISCSNSMEKKTGPRPVVIDANNVSRTGKMFQVKKLETCIKYFQDRNHKVVALLPKHMLGVVQGHEEKAKLWTLEEQKILSFTPSRKLPDGKRMAAYDDRFIVQVATELGGVIVSNDNFRDIMTEDEKWKETIEKRLLMFTWVGDMLMFPNDPLGRGGPHLEEFLRFPEEGE